MVARFPEMLAERVRDVLGLRFVDARLEDLEHLRSIVSVAPSL